MVDSDFRIARVERSLRWFEQDIPLLNMRIKELSAERQESARRFAAAVVHQTKAELEKLLLQRQEETQHQNDSPCEPAD
jgi:hypothetical protein